MRNVTADVAIIFYTTCPHIYFLLSNYNNYFFQIQTHVANKIKLYM
jgi:hypothetical protein